MMERVCERPNLLAALKRVRANAGKPGIDGMTVEELPGYLRVHWPRLREDLLAGRYQPQPVRRVAIPKGGGGERELGIPTVLDRFIQQALLQVLQPQFDPTFSDASYGFRPGRRAHDAVRRAQAYVQEGRRWVVDVDLEKFFDRVNHDILMGRLAQRIADRRVLRLIRRYLNAGVLANGVVMEREEGTPQGGPLSPLLANVLLDEVDKELERRGHAFVRYADDLQRLCAVAAGGRAGDGNAAQAVRSPQAARQRDQERGGARHDPEVPRLLLLDRRRTNGSQALGTAGHRAPEGACPRDDPAHCRSKPRTGLRAAAERISTGWKGYFRLAETPGVFRDLDEWIRHRLRAVQLKHWKRGPVIYRELIARGMPDLTARRVAANGGRWWYSSAHGLHLALPNALFDKLGIPSLAG